MKFDLDVWQKDDTLQVYTEKGDEVTQLTIFTGLKTWGNAEQLIGIMNHEICCWTLEGKSLEFKNMNLVLKPFIPNADIIHAYADGFKVSYSPKSIYSNIKEYRGGRDDPPLGSTDFYWSVEKDV